jgi:flavin reductase (DIM6/NTAB) family NADH-FMN oxidoreductase RutF
VPGPAGFTATSFTSVSLRPALVTFFVDEHASVAAAVSRASHFGVHLLGTAHEEIARSFARRGSDRFAGVAWSASPDGVPLLAEVSWLTARVVSATPVGDHLQVIGEIGRASAGSQSPPLIYHDGAYRTVTP